MTAGPASVNVTIDGAQVRERRKLAGLTVAALAAECLITRQYLSQIELSPGKTVSPPVFARICDALGVEDRRTLMLVRLRPRGEAR